MSTSEEEIENDVEDSSSDEDDDETDQEETRMKREVTWKPNAGNSSTDMGWPPDPSDECNWPPWKNLTQSRPGNPNYGPRMQLYCSTGWNLAIFGKREVRGCAEDDDRHSFLELSYAGIPGHIRIQCIENKLYLAMNRKGRLYGEVDKSEESTVFIESLHGSYNYYLSRKYAHLGWYIGIKRSGKIKPGHKTAFNQKAIKFLPRRTFLELSYAGIPGHIRIQCIENKLYLAMNRKGRLYGEVDKSEESTVFIESLHGSYNYYLSRKYAHLGWYIGIKRSGKIKPGHKTAFNQKAIKFLPRRSKFQ